MLNRRAVLLASVVAMAAGPSCEADASPTIKVYKDPSCGCCTTWADRLKAAGFKIDARRVIAETVSGSTPAMERKGFRKLLDRLEWDDILVVTKLDRLGRNAMDVRATIERLDELQVRVHCLALGGVDLTSAAGKMTMAVIAAISSALSSEASETVIRLRRRKSSSRPAPVIRVSTEPNPARTYPMVRSACFISSKSRTPDRVPTHSSPRCMDCPPHSGAFSVVMK